MKTTRAREAVRKCSRILLQERIHLNHLKRNRLKLSVENLTSTLKNRLSEDQFNNIKTIHTSHYEKEMSKTKDRQRRKFDNLLSKSNSDTINIDNSIVDKDRWVHNLSSRVLTSTEKDLSKGMNFSIAS